MYTVPNLEYSGGLLKVKNFHSLSLGRASLPQWVSLVLCQLFYWSRTENKAEGVTAGMGAGYHWTWMLLIAFTSSLFHLPPSSFPPRPPFLSLPTYFHLQHTSTIGWRPLCWSKHICHHSSTPTSRMCILPPKSPVRKGVPVFLLQLNSTYSITCFGGAIYSPLWELWKSREYMQEIIKQLVVNQAMRATFSLFPLTSGGATPLHAGLNLM